MKRLRIFLADDHTVLREGVRSLINAESDMTVVGEASDGDEAVNKVPLLNPDVVVMDVSMPRLSGIQVTAELKKICPETRVLALTVHEEKSFLRELIDAGASGYVLKRAAAEELIRAIRSVASGGVYVDPRVAEKLITSFITPKRAASRGGNARLSEREMEVLRLIAQGYTNKEIAAQLQVSVKTIETYKTRSMEKLGLRSRVDIVRLAAERGWLNPGS